MAASTNSELNLKAIFRPGRFRDAPNNQRMASGLLDTYRQKYHEKSASAKSKSQPGKISISVDNLEKAGRSKDKNDIHELPDLNLYVGKSAIQAPVSLRSCFSVVFILFPI